METIELYRPSNATEGDFFMAGYCFKCAKWPESSDAKKQCMIFLRTQAFDVEDKEYPRQWRYVDGEPTCTAFRDRAEFNADRRAKRKPRLIAVSSDDLFGAQPPQAESTTAPQEGDK
jgi:hypothetical protein